MSVDEALGTVKDKVSNLYEEVTKEEQSEWLSEEVSCLVFLRNNNKLHNNVVQNIIIRSVKQGSWNGWGLTTSLS